MKDEEGLVLKAVPRDPSEEPTAAAQTAEVAEGVKNLEITHDSSGAKKRKKKDEEERDSAAAVRNYSRIDL
jgi:hypothetical protein